MSAGGRRWGSTVGSEPLPVLPYWAVRSPGGDFRGLFVSLEEARSFAAATYGVVYPGSVQGWINTGRTIEAALQPLDSDPGHKWSTDHLGLRESNA